MLRGLRIKFICINMVVVLGMLGVIFGLVLHFTAQNLERESLQNLHQAVEQRWPGLEREPLLRLENAPGEAEKGERLLPYIYVELDQAGNQVRTAGYFDSAEEDGASRLEALVAAAMAQAEDVGVLKEYSVRYLRTETPIGTGLAFADTTAETRTMRGLVRTCLLIGAASLAAFFLLSVLLARWAVKPVEAAWQQQRRFVADASHELKTPLTVITTNAELLQSPEASPESRARYSAGILTVSRQMRALVEQLLELARADDGRSSVTFAPVELSKLVSDALLPFEPVFFENGQTLSARICPGITVSGSELQLRQTVDILLDNAGKYTPDGHSIRVTLALCGRNRCQLAVANSGNPIPPEALEQIFRRFYRVDAARSRDGGFGLGLPIARELVIRHRGRLWAESRDGINTFCAEFPTIAR